MSYTITNNIMYMRDDTGELVPVSMIASGAGQTIQAIKDTAAAAESQIDSKVTAANAAIEAKTDEQAARIPEVTTLAEDVNGLKDDLENIWIDKSENLYNPALQTVDTISPCYWNSAPTTITSWHCTAPIPVEKNTKYTIGLVPVIEHLDYGTITKPWFTAYVGIMCFDSDDKIISHTTDQTFTTPINCEYIRFNYFQGNAKGGVTLDVLNSRCVMVKGDLLPDSYVPFEESNLKEKVKELLNRNLIDSDTLSDSISYICPPIYYKIDGDNIYVVSKYGNERDLVVHLNKRGANNIFDFSYLNLIDNIDRKPSSNIADAVNLIGFGTDIHAPFLFDAVNNADGDGTATNYTGGNHAYNNVKTGRTIDVKFYINGKETNSGEGYCNFVEIKWINRIQAKNTFKADGSGRECLEEKHSLFFDGNEWKTHVEIVPLEDIIMHAWYGFQMYGTHKNDLYPKIRYVGGLNRTENIANEGTKCGNNKATKFIIYGETHMAEVEIDPTYDLGDRSLFNGSDNAIYSSTAGKVYFYIINNKAQMETGNSYYLRGAYRFRPVQ